MAKGERWPTAGIYLARMYKFWVTNLNSKPFQHPFCLPYSSSVGALFLFNVANIRLNSVVVNKPERICAKHWLYLPVIFLAIWLTIWLTILAKLF